MKFLKLLLSRTIIVLFLIILQVLFFISIAIELNNFLLFQILGAVMGVVVFLSILNKKETPEFKLPWLVLLLIFPFFTLIFYILFAKPHLPKKYVKNYEAVKSELKRCRPKVDGERIKAFLKDRADIDNYLETASQTIGHIENKTTYLKSGEEFWASLLADLKKAKSFIFMEFFIITYGQMWESIHEILLEKVKEGVEVRLIYDDIGSVGKVKGDFYKQLKNEGINCIRFNPFRPVVSGIYNNRDHRKIVVIDGVVGFTGGINIGDEYVNITNPLGKWKDSALRIEGSAVANLTELFLLSFDGSVKKSIDYDKYFLESYPVFEGGGYVHPFGDGPSLVYKELVGETNYINLINSAKNYVYITTPYLIPDYNLISSLRNAVMRGVDVRIITPHIPDKKIIFNMTRSNYKTLLEAGVKIYEYTPGFVHAKTLVADGKTAFVGTINLDYRSLVHHFECGVSIIGDSCIEDIKADFDESFLESQEISLKSFKLNPIVSFVCALLNIFSPML